jgi:N-acetylglucosaminyl-diphospho-decaprenol L-rhamnosyltransferase
MSAARKVSVVVVSYWTGSALRESLPSILSEAEVVELVIVNNGNDPESVAYLDHLAGQDSRVKILDPGANIGFSAGCNLGVSRCRGDFVALINPDLIVAPGTLATVLDVLENRPNAWVAGIRLLNADGSPQRGARREILTPWRAFIELVRLDRVFPKHPYFRRFHSYEQDGTGGVEEVPTVSGAFMVMSRGTYQRLGGFDDNMFLHVEDSDLCLRVQQLGGRVIYCGHVTCMHYRSTSDAPRAFVEWHKTRSSTYYFHKHFFDSYPPWALTIISAALWTRFWVRALPLVLGDIPALMRHRRRGHPRMAGGNTDS